jgi:hypothetical protein
MPPDRSRQAPLVGRVLRILLGLVLIAYVMPVYLRVLRRIVTESVLLVLLSQYLATLIALAVLARVVCCRGIEGTNSWRRKGPASSGHIPRCFIDRCWRLRRSRL